MDKFILLRKFHSVAIHEDIPHQQSLVIFFHIESHSQFIAIVETNEEEISSSIDSRR